MTALSRADAVELLAFIGDAHAIQGPEPFTTELLDRLAEVMNCEFATYYRIDVRGRVAYDHVACSNEVRDAAAPELGPRELRDGPGLRLTSGEVLMWSEGFDRSTRRRFEAIPWAHVFEVVDCAAVCVGSGVDRALLVLHSQERDFTERDRRKLGELHPHVHALIDGARARKRLASLTGATEAQDEFDADGFLLFDSRLEIEQASPAALRMLRTWFGGTDKRMPSLIGDWLVADARGEPLRIEGDRKTLVIDAPADGALVMREVGKLPASLTPREIEILSCIAAGGATAEVARLLWITPATVSKHLEHIYRKLGVSNRTAALAAVGLSVDSERSREIEPSLERF
jgi:DNA-binding CsgD family transcriptional regulator